MKVKSEIESYGLVLVPAKLQRLISKLELGMGKSPPRGHFVKKNNPTLKRLKNLHFLLTVFTRFRF